MSEEIWALGRHHQFEPNHFFWGAGCVDDLDALLDGIGALQQSIGVARTMSEAGVGEVPDDHVREMAEHAAHDPGMAANPRPVTPDDAFEILKRAWS